jgi:hypothetical protein
MNSTTRPSTQWQEKIAPDEAQRHAGYAKAFAEIQARKSKKFGPGRALHRKQLTGVHGRLEVLSDLPEFARAGLFAVPGSYEVWLRLSNGGMDKVSDRMPDIRGLALSVKGVQGNSALGNGPAKSQDFTLINQEQFAFPTSHEFVDFVVAASHGNGALLGFLLKRYGLLGGPRRLLAMLGKVKKPFSGFASENFFSAAPMACGRYAVRVRLRPADKQKPSPAEAAADWGADFSARLARGPLQWDLQLQPFVNESLTPIEDASVNWPTPYTTVARLSLPRQRTDSTEGTALQQQIETGVFDPWQALAEHRPLGEVQRARKVVYFESQTGRNAA